MLTLLCVLFALSAVVLCYAAAAVVVALLCVLLYGYYVLCVLFSASHFSFGVSLEFELVSNFSLRSSLERIASVFAVSFLLIRFAQ